MSNILGIHLFKKKIIYSFIFFILAFGQICSASRLFIRNFAEGGVPLRYSPRGLVYKKLFPGNIIYTDFDFEPEKHSNTWIQVRFPEKAGKDHRLFPLFYIHSHFVTQAIPTPFSPPFERGDNAVIRNTSGLGVIAREKSDINSSSLFTIQETLNPATVEKIKGEWCAFRHYSGILGWVPLRATAIFFKGMEFLVSTPKNTRTPLDIEDGDNLSVQAWPYLYIMPYGRVPLSFFSGLESFLRSRVNKNIGYSFLLDSVSSIWGNWSLFERAGDYYMINRNIPESLGFPQKELVYYRSFNRVLSYPQINANPKSQSGKKQNNFYSISPEKSAELFMKATMPDKSNAQILLKIEWPKLPFAPSAINDMPVFQMSNRGILTFLDPIFSKIRYFSIKARKLLGSFSLLRTVNHKRCLPYFSDFAVGPDNTKAAFNQSLGMVEIFDSRGFLITSIEGFSPCSRIFSINGYESASSASKKGRSFFIGVWQPEAGQCDIFNWNGNYLTTFKCLERPFFMGLDFYQVSRGASKYILKKYNILKLLQLSKELALTVHNIEPIQTNKLKYTVSKDMLGLLGLDKVSGTLLFQKRTKGVPGISYIAYNLVEKSYKQTPSLPISPFCVPFGSDSVCLVPGGDSIIWLTPFRDNIDKSRTIYQVKMLDD